MLEIKNYDNLFDSLDDVIIEEFEDNFDLQSYNDIYMTDEQKKRDRRITLLLSHYVNAYQRKQDENQSHRKSIVETCCFILIVFTVIFAIFIFNLNINNEIAVNSIIALMTTAISYLTLVIGILKIVTTYVFPKNDEEYITKIVALIQNNDLKNKKQNYKVQNNINDKELL